MADAKVNKNIEKLLNFSKAIGLVKDNKVDPKFFVMLMQLDYVSKNIPKLNSLDSAKTEVAKELYKGIQNNYKTYVQFSNYDNLRIAYYGLETILSGDDEKLKEKLNGYASDYNFSLDNAKSRGRQFFEDIYCVAGSLGNMKSTLFDVSGYFSLDEEDDLSTELNCSLDVKEFLDEMIRMVVDDIVKMQSSLYGAGYSGMVPDGALWKVGELSAEPAVDKDSGTRAKYTFTQRTNPSLLKLYRYISNATGGQFDLSKYDGHMKVSISNIQKGCYYYPHFQVRNSCGLAGLDSALDKWLSKNKKSKIGSLDELNSYITDEVTKGIKVCLSANQERFGFSKVTDVSTLIDNKDLERLFNQFRRAFTTCALVAESKKDVVLKLRLCTGSDDIGNVFSKESLEAAIKKGDICNKYTKITDWILDESKRILTITFVMDEKRYNSFPFFAANVLEAIKKNGGPSWKSVIIGKDNNDKMFTLNLASAVNRVLAIIAGSRSGKGVLTMKIESDARALGIPVFYLDYKPDMSRTYYEIAKKLGSEAFAFDGLSLTAELGRDFNILYNYDQIPQEIRDTIAGADFANPDKQSNGNSAIFDVKEFAYFTSYVRGVQLICNLIALRAKALKNNGVADNFTIAQLGGERILVVLDEMEKFCIYADTLLKKNGYLDSIKDRVIHNLIASGLTDKKAKEHKCLLWFDNYKNWVSNVFTSLESKDKAEIGESGTNIIILAQSTNIDNTWGIVGQKLSTLIVNGIKFCGNGSNIGGGSSKYGSGACPPEWKAKLPNRYFVIQKEGGGNVTENGSALVKTYFLLNEVYNADGSESKYVKDMFNSLGKDADAVRAEVTMEDGKLNPALGYLGYIKSLTGFTDEQLGQTFQQAFDIGQMIATQVMGYSNLYECMYDLGSFTAGGKVYESYNEAENKASKEESTQETNDNSPSLDSILNNLEHEEDEEVDFDLSSSTNEGSENAVNEGDTSNEVDEVAGTEESVIENNEVPINSDKVEEQQLNNQETSVINEDELNRQQKSDNSNKVEEQQPNNQETSVITENNLSNQQESLNNNNQVTQDKPTVETSILDTQPVNVNEPMKNTSFVRDSKGNVSVDKSNLTNYSALNNNNSIDCSEIRNARVFRNASKLARTANGAKVFKEDSCKYIFNLIDRSIGLNNVTKVTLANESITVNKMVLDLNGIVGGDTGRKLSDLMSFKVFNSKFKGITYLEINGSFIDNYILEFNLEASSKALLGHLFNNFHLLSEVKIGNTVTSKTRFRLDNRTLDNTINQERQKKSLNGLFARLGRNSKKNSSNLAYSDSSSMSSYEKPARGGRLGKVRDAMGIGAYKVLGIFDYLLNGK